MVKVTPFRRHKRLKSLDELDNPVWRIDTPRQKQVSAIWLALSGIAAGAVIGLAVILL